MLFSKTVIFAPSISNLRIKYGMQAVLKLYFGLRVKSLWRMAKELGFIAIPTILLFLLLGVVMVLKLASAPIYYSVLLDVSLLLTYHFSRGDSAFLYSTFGTSRTKRLFLMEYMLLSIPFLCFFLYCGELWAVAVALLSLVPLSFAPCGGVSLRLPTFPCLASGSYEYHRAGRLTMLLLLPLMAGGAIGTAIGNRHLVIGVSMIAASVFSMLLMREWHVAYLFHYKSAVRFLSLKMLFAFRNACVVFLPFMLSLMLVDFGLSQLLWALSYCLGTSILLFQVEMLCFVSGGTNGGNDIISMLAFMALNAVFYLSLVLPVFMPVSIVISGGLAYYAYSVIKKYR